MRKLQFFAGFAALLVLVGAGCARTTSEPVDQNANGGETQEEMVKVGVMVPLTGDASSYGESVKKAVELAKRQLGAENIELVFEDSKCEGKEAATAVQKLISVDGVQAIVGELCSGATLAAAPVAEQNKVVMISPASTAPTLTDAGEYIFRTIPSDAAQGAFGAKLVSDRGLKKLAVLYTNDDYGVGFDKVLKDRFPQYGGEVVASEAVDRQTTELRAQLTKIKAANPDALYIISNSPDTASAALKQAKELGLEVTVFGSEGLKSEDVLKGAQGAAEGMVLTGVSAGTDGFIKAHESVQGSAPGPFAAQAYDAFQAIHKAVEAGANTGEEIKEKLKGMSFEGVSGEISFDTNGDVGGVYTVYVVKDGAFVKE